MSPTLRRWLGHKPKRDFQGSCTPCLTLKAGLDCHDACCRTLLVPIAQEDLDDGLVPHPPFVDVLARAPNGDCAHYDAATRRCGAWERRPLVCRTYDCRDDVRFATLRLLEGSRVEAPPACPGCDRALEAHCGAREACDGHAVCIHCGAPFVLELSPAPRNVMTLVPAPAADAVRRRYHFESLCLRERWAEALAAVDADGAPALKRARAVVLAELGRVAEARAALEPLAKASPGALLDLAWAETRAGDDAAAEARLRRALPTLLPVLTVRAHLMLSNIARRKGDAPAAALFGVLAVQADRALGRRSAALREHLQELLHASPASRAAVESAALLLARRIEPQRLDFTALR